MKASVDVFVVNKRLCKDCGGTINLEDEGEKSIEHERMKELYF